MKKTIAIFLIYFFLLTSILMLTGCGNKKNEFKINYGKLGDYGQTVNDGTNIIYKIPAGTYDVNLSLSSTSSIGFLTIRDNNSKDYNIINEYKFDLEDNKNKTITILEGQYVHITVDTSFNFYEQ